MSVWTEADDLLDEQQPAAPARSSSVWDEADALLGATPAAAAPSNVWADADALLSSAPAKPRPAVGPIEQRPSPFAAGGVTDETSVRVNGVPTWGALRAQMTQQPRGTVGDATLDDALRRGASDDELETIARNQARMQPPAFSLPKPSPDALIKSVRAKTMTGVDRAGMPVYGDPPPIGTVPVLDAPAVGIPRVVKGVRQMIPPIGGGTGKTNADVVHGANEALEGLMQTAEPAIAAGAVTNPAGTAYALVRAWLVQQVGEAAATAVGADSEVARLVGNVGATLSGGLSAEELARKATERAQSAGRVLTLASRLSGSGFGPGDVPAFRANPVTDEISGSAVAGEGAPEASFIDQFRRPAPPIVSEIDQVLAERPEAVSRNVPRGTSHPAPDMVPPGEEALYNDERRVGNTGPPAGVAERRLAPSEAVRAAYKADPEGERAAAEEARRRADQFRAEQADAREGAEPGIVTPAAGIVTPEVLDAIDQVLAEPAQPPPAAVASVQPPTKNEQLVAEIEALHAKLGHPWGDRDDFSGFIESDPAGHSEFTLRSVLKELQALDKPAARPGQTPAAAAARPAPVTLSVDYTGHHHGQDDGVVVATDATGQRVGRLEFSVYQGVPRIAWVEVTPALRRQGIGRQLVDRLKAETPGHNIEWGTTTDDGTAFRAALERPRETPAPRQLVRNRAGEPQTFFHATDADDFDQFEHTQDIGFHFGSRATAEKRAEALEDTMPNLMAESIPAPRIIPVHLAITHPLRLPDLHDWTPKAVLNEFVDKGILTDEEADGIDLVDRETVGGLLERAGYDGIVYANETEGGGDSYIAFKPEQIIPAGDRFDAGDPTKRHPGENPAADIWHEVDQVLAEQPRIEGTDGTAETAAGPGTPHGAQERLSPASGGAVSPESDQPGAQAAPAETAKARAKRERAERRARRKQERDDYRAAVAEDERTLIQDAIDRAVAEGYTGDHETLRAVILDRVQVIRSFDADYNDSDRNPRRMLEEIARLGGIGIKAEAGTTRALKAGEGMQGEIRWLQSFARMNATKTSGALGGVSGVFSEGPRALSLDGVLEGLKQNGEFNYITSINDLLEELRGATKLDEPAADDQAVARAVAMLESSGYWWAESPVVDETTHPADAPGADRETADLADVEFDLRDFEVEGLDVLETGEVQPHLPGAGAVRAEEKATPEVADAPFSLSSEAADTAGVEGDLFAGTHERPTFGGSNRGMATPEGPRRWDAGEKQKPAPPVSVKKKDGGTQLNADLVPGAGKFVERDLLPGLVKAGEELVAVENGVRAVWAPDRISQASRAEAAVIRSNLALRRQRTIKAQRAMRALERAWDTAPRSLQLEFAMAVDEGRYDDLEQLALTVTTGPLLRRQQQAQSLRTMAAMFKRLNDYKRAEANALGGRVGRIVHYYPREWVRPGKVRAMVERMLHSRKPLQGRAGFKKARTRDKVTGEPFTFKQLYDAGFRPVEYNPVRAHLRKWLEMDKWIAARRILLEGKAAKTTKFVRIGETPPPGWHRYDESFGTVYAPPIITIQESYDERLMSELVAFAQNLGIKMARKPNIGKGPSVWGYAMSTSAGRYGTGPRERVPGVSPGSVVTKFAGAEEVLTHEIGHILDDTYGLWERIVEPPGRETRTLTRGKRKGQTVTRTRKQDKATVARRKRVLEQLRKLADMRYEGADETKVPQGYKDYVREKAEQMANVVHAYIHIPERMKEVAPDAYWAVFNTVKDHPELSGLNEIQKARGVRLGSAEADVRVNGLVIAGYYYGPPEAVRLLDNHLSPGLGGNKALNLYRFMGNLLNQVQLGLSGFHLVGTAMNSAISKGALALEHASRGQFADAARRAIEVPVSPLVDIIRGNRALKHYYEHDANFRDVLDTSSLVVRGGGGVGWDTFWHSSAPERFMQAIHATAAEAKEGNYPGAALRAALVAWRAFPALVELQAKPVMEWWVPRLKLAAYLDLARLELRDLGEIPDELELRKVLGDAWDSVDNRFGELVYDNLFWHRILKDAGMASVRALGWNVGTVREVFGAPLAQVRSFLKPEPRVRQTGERLEPLTGERIPEYSVGREPWLTHKGAYFLALVFLSAVFGALYQKFHTGLNPGELEDGDYDTSTALLDLWFPRTGGTTADGRPERASLPTYIKDVYAFGKHPWPTMIHKLHPILSLMGQIWQNEDYYGNAIRDPEDPALRQALDLATYMEGQYRPISLTSYFERQKNSRKGTAVKAVESFLGINVAPASVTRTPLEEYLHEVAPTFSRTKDQAARSATSRDVRNKLADKDIPSARQAAVEGNMTRRQALAAETASQLSYVQRAFSHLSLKQGIHAYEVASPHEREGLAKLLERKADNADVPADEVGELRAKITEALKLPRSTKKPRIEDLTK